jgi:hypothetical protein
MHGLPNIGVNQAEGQYINVSLLRTKTRKANGKKAVGIGEYVLSLFVGLHVAWHFTPFNRHIVKQIVCLYVSN